MVTFEKDKSYTTSIHIKKEALLSRLAVAQVSRQCVHLKQINIYVGIHAAINIFLHYVESVEVLKSFIAESNYLFTADLFGEQCSSK